MPNNHIFSGIVIAGQKRGRLLGFPTANVPLTKKIQEGIYASTIEIDGISYRGATFIGEARTYNEKDYKSETYILDFNVDIYGKKVTLTLHKKIRGNKKFTSEKDLITQMHKDIISIRAYFSSSKSQL